MRHQSPIVGPPRIWAGTLRPLQGFWEVCPAQPHLSGMLGLDPSLPRQQSKAGSLTSPLQPAQLLPAPALLCD